MITASIVTYFPKDRELSIVIDCALNSSIDLIYVIDNTPNDYLRTIENKSSKIHYIHNENTGYGSAHNIAIRDAMKKSATYHVVLNPDIEFKPGTIEALSKYMDNNPTVGQVMPKVVYPNGELQYLCKMIPTPIDLIFKRFLPKNFFKERAARFQLKFTGYNTEMNVPYLSGCFMFFRVSALREVGLFDERFFMYPEDIDITRRMHALYKTMFYPAVTVVHNHAAESYKSKKMLKVHIINMIKYFNKWGWLFDKERRTVNRDLLRELNYIK